MMKLKAVANAAINNDNYNEYKEGYDKKKFAAFANSFDKVIFNLIRN